MTTAQNAAQNAAAQTGNLAGLVAQATAAQAPKVEHGTNGIHVTPVMTTNSAGRSVFGLQLGTEIHTAKTAFVSAYQDKVEAQIVGGLGFKPQPVGASCELLRELDLLNGDKMRLEVQLHAKNGLTLTTFQMIPKRLSEGFSKRQIGSVSFGHGDSSVDSMVAYCATVGNLGKEVETQALDILESLSALDPESAARMAEAVAQVKAARAAAKVQAAELFALCKHDAKIRHQQEKELAAAARKAKKEGKDEAAAAAAAAAKKQREEARAARAAAAAAAKDPAAAAARAAARAANRLAGKAADAAAAVIADATKQAKDSLKAMADAGGLGSNHQRRIRRVGGRRGEDAQTPPAVTVPTAETPAVTAPTGGTF